jgi:hypothetical protein
MKVVCSHLVSVVDSADSCIPRSAGKWNKLACVAQEMVRASLWVVEEEGMVATIMGV